MEQAKRSSNRRLLLCLLALLGLTSAVIGVAVPWIHLLGLSEMERHLVGEWVWNRPHLHTTERMILNRDRSAQILSDGAPRFDGVWWVENGKLFICEDRDDAPIKPPEFLLPILASPYHLNHRAQKCRM